ncbi:hypothetical protein P43SY_003595 [Pythium insidiosum]|uniref:Protein kinase domain-containing protein n=1 Tax=Pythium insidiosum TaxID=114742 RepID=A0AAD5Q5H1_PYTIN|nr:hypothetical protein P43SY_003595 [Pythium insidiosum]
MMMALVEGQTRLGPESRYRFLSRLASGTFAHVVKAEDTQTGALVAIKCVKDAAYGPIGMREAALLRALNARDPGGHVAIVRLLDVFTADNGVVCLVLELLGRPVLALTSHAPPPWRRARWPRLEPRQHKLLVFLQSDARDELQADAAQATAAPLPMSLDEIRQMTVQLCGALSFLHDQGVIHADLKPENVVRAAGPTTQRQIKLVDFGNCIERAQIPLYEEDDALGRGFDIQTLTYRAPEVAAGLSIAPAMDLWSLGCVLFECASGEPLLQFAGATAGPSELLGQIETLRVNGKTLDAMAPAYRSARSSHRRAPKPASSSAAPLSLARRLQAVYDRRAAMAEDDGVPTDPDEWQSFTALLERLLDANPSTRISAREVFLHPFVQSLFPFQLVFAPPPARPPVDTTDALSLASPTTTALSSDSSPRKAAASRNRRKKKRENDTAGMESHPSTLKAKRVALQQALRLIPSAATLRDNPGQHKR